MITEPLPPGLRPVTALPAYLDPRRALTFAGIPLAYWRDEAARGTPTALARLRLLCEERGCDFERTMDYLKGTQP
jgi:hypothetical protein